MQGFVAISILIACCLATGYAMECYNCNTTYTTERKDDVCKGIESIGRCVDPSICITAIFEIQDGPMKKYNALKQCYVPQNGLECENLLKNIQNMNPTSKIQYYNNRCQICDKDGCNKSAAIAVAVPTFLAFIISYLLCKLI